jgi:hypothetical protein
MYFVKDLNMKEVCDKMGLKNLSNTKNIWGKEILPGLLIQLGGRGGDAQVSDSRGKTILAFLYQRLHWFTK